MYHLIILFLQMEKTAPLRVAAVKAGQEACHALWTYDLYFVGKCAIQTFLIALVVAFASRWTYEYPFHWVRQRYGKCLPPAVKVKKL